MKRAVSRSFCCAVRSAACALLLCLASLAFALPASAQTTAPAAAATKPAAAKPVAHAAKTTRWAPRRYYYSRWRPYSRWGWHPAWHKPAVAAKPGAKPAAKAVSKPAPWAKPQSTAAKLPTLAKPAASAKPAIAAKPASWTKPVAKPAAGSKPAAAKPAAPKAVVKPVSHPIEAKAPVKPAAAAIATAKKAQAAPQNLTRDANNGTQIVTADSPIAGGDRNDFAEQAAKMAGAVVFVVLVIVGIVFLLRKYNLVPVSETSASLAAAQPAKAGAPKGLAAAFQPVFGNLSPAKSQPPKANTAAQDLSDAMIGNGGMQIVGAQPLPGSGTILYLVRIEDHMVLLGASYAGGVRLLAEWEKDDRPESEQEKTAFDSFLRQQGIAAEPEREEEEHTFATIRARLNSTAERLAGLRQEFGN